MYDKKINSGDRLCNTQRSFGSISPLSLAKIRNKAKSLSFNENYTEGTCEFLVADKTEGILFSVSILTCQVMRIITTL